MKEFHLWDGLEKPYYKDNDLAECELIQWGNVRSVFNITEPMLTVYPVQDAGVGVIVIPGGGYEFVAIGHEGHDVAQALAGVGITAAVLKYRLPNPASSDAPQLVPITDARRALKVFHQKTGLSRVGLVGFSAGSHLSAVVSLFPGAEADETPAFAGLIYGVTIPSETNREWLENFLYFRKISDAEAAENNLLERVTPQTPPTFLVHACDDDTCPVKESTRYAEKLLQHGVPVEMHLFPKGGHGFGLGRAEDGTNQWLGLFINWLNRMFA